MKTITARSEAAQVFRDLADRLSAFPALAATCHTLAGATTAGDEHELARCVAEFGRKRLVAMLGEAEFRRLRSQSKPRTMRAFRESSN